MTIQRPVSFDPHAPRGPRRSDRRRQRHTGLALLLAGLGLAFFPGSRLDAEPGSQAQRQASSAVPDDDSAEPETFIDLLGDDQLSAWRGYRQDAVPTGWTLVDGILSVEPREGGRGDLITRDSYENFELRLEWRVGAAGNSGIFFRVSEDQPATYSSGPEMQILDNQGHVDGSNPLTSAGSNYALHAPASDETRPLGEFNEVRLRVEGDRVRQWLNGVLVVDYRLWTDSWEQLVAGSKFSSMPKYGRNRKGHIALQDHGDPVSFRNVRLAVLP